MIALKGTSFREICSKAFRKMAPLESISAVAFIPVEEGFLENANNLAALACNQT
jgi:hypothetical protein